jgi:hypothetical protein
VLQKELFSTALTAEMVGIACDSSVNSLGWENVGAALRVLDQLCGALVSRNLLPVGNTHTFYQTTQQLVNHNDKKNEDSKTYHQLTTTSTR